MRFVSLFCLCLLSISSFADGFVTVGITGVNSPAETLAKYAANLGRIEFRDGVSGAYTIRLNKAISPSDAVAQLSKKRGVLFARESQPSLKPEETNILNVDELKTYIREMKARNLDRAKMARALGKPALQKTDKIKTGYLEAWLFWFEERAFPFKTIDTQAYEKAVEHRDSMDAAFANQGDGLGSATWQFVGPRNLDIPYSTYYGIKPLSGRVGAIAVDPSNNSNIYLGGANGGVWKSTDGGVNWTAITDNWTYLTVSSIAIDPSNSQTIYVGTGDYQGSRPYQMGIMKSTNGGSSWTNLGSSSFGTRAVSKILIDPENPQIITVTTGRGSGGNGFVWRSTNGGTSWTNVLNTAAGWCTGTIGAMDGTGQRAYYVSGSGTGGNVWKSLDRGATWIKLTTPASSGSHTVISVAASPNFPGTVYIVVNADRKIYKSIDFGATWADVTTGFPNGSNNYFWSQSTYNFFLAVSTAPGPVDTIYVGMIDAVMSKDGGATWQSIGGPTYVSASLLHNDQHVVTVDPTNPNAVMVGNDGGVYRYTFNPGTGTGIWDYLSGNMGLTMFYKMDIHPTNPAYMIGGTQDNATPVAIGDLNNWENCGGGDGGFGAINPVNPNIQYSEAQYLALYRTSNNWSSSSSIAPSYGTDSVAFVAPFVLDPNNSNLLYAGTTYLYRRTDGTGVWENRLGGTKLSNTGTIRFIAVAPGDSNRLYTVASDGQVWMSTNAGANWTQIDTGSPSLPVKTFNYITVNRANKNDIIVSCSGTGSGHIWRCANTTAATRVWTNISGSGITGLPDIPANAVLRDSFDFENTFFVGTDIGAFMTENGGQTWKNMTAPLGLPNVQVNDFRIQNRNTLYAATYGRGMWKYDLPPIVLPSTAAFNAGVVTGGTTQLSESDDQRMTSVIGATAKPITLTLVSTSPVANPSEFHFFLEASCSRPGTQQELEFFNYSTNKWQTMNTRLSSLGDKRFIVKVTSGANVFVKPGTLEISARIRWSQSSDILGPDSGATLSVDRAVWRIYP